MAQGLLKMCQRHKEGLDVGLETRCFSVIIPTPSLISAMPGVLLPQPWCPHLLHQGVPGVCRALRGHSLLPQSVITHNKTKKREFIQFIESCSSPLILARFPRGCSRLAAEKEDAVGVRAATACRDERDTLYHDER